MSKLSTLTVYTKITTILILPIPAIFLEFFQKLAYLKLNKLLKF
ncbi:hypothetical protein GXM_01517 [Nostoc sphaeroides CCNUC1]|uniref:Uncharacterized protein n=1 Tax=Nostoc sphaeroides CCNUC1 TaxID=2653204 RepID=A0A5P8VUL5_9NOSO|nr:hypothetical protein GXM_01517 [Nostoc sphaeroides CCNUC1]